MREIKGTSEGSSDSGMPAPPVRTIYRSGSAAHGDRYAVAMVVGYGHGPDQASGPREAAELALSLVREGGTVWTVLDRETGEVTVWEDAGCRCEQWQSCEECFRRK